MTETNDSILKIVSVLAVAALALVLFNGFLAFGIGSKLAVQQEFLSSLRVASVPEASGNLSAGQQSGNEMEALMAELIPRGVPAVYGSELGVSFEDPVNSLNVLAGLDGDLYKTGKIKFADLSAENQQRYINIGTSISCEYCCDATSITFADGRVACGCAHSAAMRGLAKYLLQNHASEYSDSQILGELTKWKTLFFPKQMLQKAIQLKEQNGEINATTLNELPDMVGGC